VSNNIRSSLAFGVCVTLLGCASSAFGQTPKPVRDTHSLAGVFTSTIGDFRRLPSEDTLTWLTIGATVAAAGQAKDWNVTNGFSASRMGDVFEPGELIGGARMQMASALALYTLGRATRHNSVAAVGGDLVRAQILAQAMTAGIKLSVRRHRPDGGEFSFPSGHTSVSFATATVLQRHFGWKAGIPAYGMAAYVAASRVQVKRHFLSDVAFGAAIGIAAGRTVTVGRGRAQFALAPSMAPGQAGVSFTLLDKR
jgi:membrane-associated phospholipid phosphatase